MNNFPIELKDGYAVVMEDTDDGKRYECMVISCHNTMDKKDELCVTSKECYFPVSHIDSDFVTYQGAYKIMEVYDKVTPKYSYDTFIKERKLLWNREEDTEKKIKDEPKNPYAGMSCEEAKSQFIKDMQTFNHSEKEAEKIADSIENLAMLAGLFKLLGA